MADEQTITVDPVDEIGAEQALPVEQTEEVTADPDTSQQQVGESIEGEQGSSLPEVDDKLKSFAKGQGIEDVSELTPRELSLLKSAYDSQADFSRKRQGAKLKEAVDTVTDSNADVEAVATGQDPELLKRLARVEAKDTVRDFFDANPGAREQEQAMIEELGRRPYLAGDLEALYAVVRSKSPEQLKSEGGKQALQSLAGKQQASAVRGSATNPAPSTKKDDPFLKGLME